MGLKNFDYDDGDDGGDGHVDDGCDLLELHDDDLLFEFEFFLLMDH